MALKQYAQLIKNYSRFLFFGGWHSFYSGIGQTYLVALFVPFMREKFDASVAEFGLFYSVATLASAFVLPFLGGLIDRMNLRLYSALNGVLAATACFVMAFAPSMPFVLFGSLRVEPFAILGLFLLRLSGQGLMGHICSTSIGRYFGRNRGKASSISDQGHSVGEAILPPLVVLLMATYGWQNTYVILGLSCLLLFLPVSVALLRPSDDFQHPGRTAEVDADHDDEEAHWTHKELLRSSYFYAVLPLACMGAFALTGLFFLQVAISVAKGWDDYWLAACFFVFPISVIAASLLVGPLIDSIGARRIFPFQVWPLALGVFVLGMFQTPWIAPVYLILCGASVGMSKSVTGAMWAEVYGTRHLGAIRSIASTVMVFSTAVSPALFGWMLDASIPANTLLIGLALFIASTSVPALLAPTPKKRVRAV